MIPPLPAQLSKVRGQMSLRSDELGALMEKYRGDAEQARMELQDAKKSFDTQVRTGYGTPESDLD